MNSDPAYFGPGVWFTIHHTAARAKTQEKIHQFIVWIMNLVIELPCSTCSGHAKEFVIDHHPKEYMHIRAGDNDELVGMFYWSWLFHNSANKYAEKPEITWERACEIWYHVLQKTAKTIEDEDKSLFDIKLYIRRNIYEGGYGEETIKPLLKNAAPSNLMKPNETNLSSKSRCKTCNKR